MCCRTPIIINAMNYTSVYGACITVGNVYNDGYLLIDIGGDYENISISLLHHCMAQYITTGYGSITVSRLSKLPCQLHFTEHVCLCLYNCWRRVSKLLFRWRCDCGWNQPSWLYPKLWNVLLKFLTMTTQIIHIGGKNYVLGKIVGNCPMRFWHYIFNLIW